MTKFKVGQLVKVVDGSCYSTISNGEVHKVIDVTSDHVKIENTNTWYYNSVFTCHCPLNTLGISKGDLIHCGNGETVYKVRYIDSETESVIGVSQTTQVLYEIPFKKVRKHQSDGVAVVKFIEGLNRTKSYYFKIKPDTDISLDSIVVLKDYDQALVRVVDVYKDPSPYQMERATKYLRGDVLKRSYKI